MLSIIRRNWVPGGHRFSSLRGVALATSVSVALVPGLLFAASAHAAPAGATVGQAVLPHVKHHQSPD